MTRAELITAYIASREIPTTTLETHLASGMTVEDLVAQQVDLCCAEFSADVPHRKTKSGTADGELIPLAGWFYGSRVISFETPEGSRLFLPAREYEISTSGDVRVYEGLPLAQTYCITYAALHELPATGDITIPAARHAAFFRLVTARLLARVATAHGETRKPEIAADSVDYQSKAREYTALAREAYAEYRRLVGLTEKPSARPALGFAPVEGATRRLPMEAPWPSR